MYRVLIWIRNGLLLIVGLIAVAIGIAYGLSEYRLRRTITVDPSPIAVPAGDAAITEGHRLTVARGCADCHGQNMAGTTFVDEPMVGKIAASNLTSGTGGVGKNYTPATWARAVRHGIGSDGHSLVIMPSHEFAAMSDADMGAIIAYLQSLPAVDHVNPPISIGPLGRLLLLTGQVTVLPAEVIDHSARPAQPVVGITAEYGHYLSAGCSGCHGKQFSGGPIPGSDPSMPPAGNLTPDTATGIGSWSEEDFIRAIREGKRPDGSIISDAMPWKNFSKMTDTELKALYLYLRQLPALAKGNR